MPVWNAEQVDTLLRTALRAAYLRRISADLVLEDLLLREFPAILDPMLRALDDDLWVAETSYRILGIDFGGRATIVRLGTGDLWIHSPVVLDDGLRGEIEQLGPVRYLVAGNRHHHAFIPENVTAFPQARLFLAPGLADKKPTLGPSETLGEAAPWAADVEQQFLDGWPFASETLFLHRRTRTLLVTDLVFNVQSARNVLERWTFKAYGVYQRLGPSRLVRTTIRDKARLRASLDTVLKWEFERVIPTHGAILDRGGRDALRDAFAFL